MGTGRDSLQQTQVHRARAVLHPIAYDSAIHPDCRSRVALAVKKLPPVTLNIKASGLPAHHSRVE
jgi:hypothetical protein